MAGAWPGGAGPAEGQVVPHSRSGGDPGDLGGRLRYESDPLPVTPGERERPRPRR